MRPISYPFNLRPPRPQEEQPPGPSLSELLLEQILVKLDNLTPQPPAEIPAPVVHVEPPDLSEIVQAVVGLKPGASAEDIAKAVQNTLQPPHPVDFTPASEVLREVSDTLKKLEFRLQTPQTHVAGPGSVAIRYTQAGDLKPNTDGSLGVTNSYLSSQVGTWGYHAGVAGTVVVPASERVLGITAHCTTAGSMTVNAGDSLPIPANVGVFFTPQGNLTAPTIVFTGTDSYCVETVK